MTTNTKAKIKTAAGATAATKNNAKGGRYRDNNKTRFSHMRQLPVSAPLVTLLSILIAAPEWSERRAL
jgi:hypothetical protein